MAPPLQHDGYGRDRGEQDEAEGERRPRPPQLHERGHGQGREVGPPMEVRRPKRRADDEEGERQEHPRRAAPDRIERAGGAAAAELHAEAEDEGADHDRDADRCDDPLHRPPNSDPAASTGKNSAVASASMTIRARRPAPRRSAMKTRHAEVKPNAA